MMKFRGGGMISSANNHLRLSHDHGVPGITVYMTMKELSGQHIKGNETKIPIIH